MINKLIIECKHKIISDFSDKHYDEFNEANLKILANHINEEFPGLFHITTKRATK